MTSAVRLKSLERGELREVVRRRVAATHRAEHAVVARLERHVEMARRGRRLAERRDEVAAEVVHLDRRKPQPLDARDRARLADETRQRISGPMVAEAAEIDSGQDDLAVTLLDTSRDLGEHRPRRAAAGRPADERYDAERARERAAVLDLHERAYPVESRTRLYAADRADLTGDGSGHLLARTGKHRHVGRDLLEGRSQIRGAPRDVDAVVRPCRSGDGLTRFRDGLVRDAACIHDRDVTSARHLAVAVAEQPLAHRLRVRVRHLAAQEAHGEGRHRRD